MKIYYSNDFEGHNPVGTAAVIVAQDKGHAHRLLRKELRKNHSLDLKGFTDLPVTFEEVDPTKAKAIVLLDGEY